MSAPIIQTVSDQNIDRVKMFLDKHIETSMFLASNLETYGPKLSESPNSGDFKCIESSGKIMGVFCLTQRGIVLAETGGKTELTNLILESCIAEEFQIEGVVGEWVLAESIWNRHLERSNAQETLRSKETLYRLLLTGELESSLGNSTARLLEPADFDAWYMLIQGYLKELSFSENLSREQQEVVFEEYANTNRWWGLFDGKNLLSIASLNAVHQTLGQIGGVYTRPEYRRQGYSRAVLHKLISDGIELHGLEKLILFTGEENVAAKAQYESFGFEKVGDYAIFFCTPEGI